jgi:hypothetical protein
MIVAYDPFAREGLERATRANHDPRYSCAWCGQMPDRLHRYDGSDWFCNLECFRSFYS